MTRAEREWRALVRRACDCTGKPYPIVVLPGRVDWPRLVGRSYHWVTPGGRPVPERLSACANRYTSAPTSG
jgi:hypothetical protein